MVNVTIKKQSVNNQYIADVMYFNSIDDKNKFIEELEKFKNEISKTNIISSQDKTKVTKELLKAVKEAKKKKVDKKLLTIYMKNVKNVVKGVATTTSLVIALEKAIQAIQTLF